MCIMQWNRFQSLRLPPSNHLYVLEHSLHQMLSTQHLQNIFMPLPRPTKALVGVSKRRRLAGPAAYSRDELADVSQRCDRMIDII